jgi:hypothetical protein
MTASRGGIPHCLSAIPRCAHLLSIIYLNHQMKFLGQAINDNVGSQSPSSYTLSLSLGNSSTRSWLLKSQNLEMNIEALQQPGKSHLMPTQLDADSPIWRFGFFQNITIHAFEHRSTSALQNSSLNNLTFATEHREGRQHEYLAVAISVRYEEGFRWLKLERLAPAAYPSICECSQTI